MCPCYVGADHLLNQSEWIIMCSKQWVTRDCQVVEGRWNWKVKSILFKSLHLWLCVCVLIDCQQQKWSYITAFQSFISDWTLAHEFARFSKLREELGSTSHLGNIVYRLLILQDDKILQTAEKKRCCSAEVSAELNDYCFYKTLYNLQLCGPLLSEMCSLNILFSSAT